MHEFKDPAIQRTALFSLQADTCLEMRTIAGPQHREAAPTGWARIIPCHLSYPAQSHPARATSKPQQAFSSMAQSRGGINSAPTVLCVFSSPDAKGLSSKSCEFPALPTGFSHLRV